jgi:SPP1 gp7 family putative phage head morphogenesis protein
MPALAKSSFNATVRHQVLLERLKAGEVRKILPFLREVDREVRLRLSGDELTEYSRARLEILLVETESLITAIFGRYSRQLLLDLREVGEAEALFEARSLTNAVSNPDFEAVAPASSQVYAAALAAPLSIRGAQGGKLLEPLLADFTKAQTDRVVGVIRQGAYEGRTNADIVRSIRGTKALKYSDGILATTSRQAEAVTRTAVQHMSSVARMQTYAANADLVQEYEWLSTLDNRTSEICQSLSGTRWKVGEGPMPPAHINCRSTTVPVLDERFDFLKEGATQSSQFGPVDADLTYFEWLKGQPAAFQDSTLGPARGALLRNGGLSAERFAELQLSRNFKPLTLAEMQRLEPLAFEQAGITINPNTGRIVNP